jgi:ribosomal protein L7Ae-like RNA K-turn-binding protein
VKNRAFKRLLNVNISENEIGHLIDLIKRTTEKLIGEVVSLARRAGTVSVGREAVKRSMKEDQTGALLMANDLSDSNVRQILDNAGRKRVPVYSPFKGQVLARKVGLDFVSVLGIDREPFVSRINTLCSSYDELNEKS